MFSLPPSLARSDDSCSSFCSVAAGAVQLPGERVGVLDLGRRPDLERRGGQPGRREALRRQGGSRKTGTTMEYCARMYWLWHTYCTCRVLCYRFRARVSMHAMPYSVHAVPPCYLIVSWKWRSTRSRRWTRRGTGPSTGSCSARPFWSARVT